MTKATFVTETATDFEVLVSSSSNNLAQRMYNGQRIYYNNNNDVE
jgi:hypothetical protein